MIGRDGRAVPRSRPLGRRARRRPAPAPDARGEGRARLPPAARDRRRRLAGRAAGDGAGGTTELVTEWQLSHFNIYGAPSPRLHAEWHNRLQEVARSTRLGIPVTIASDPRHTYSHEAV